MASLAEKCSPAWRIKIAVARPWSPGTNVSSDSGPNQWAGDGVPVGHSNPNSQSYRHHADLNHLRRRIRELNAANKMDGEIAAVLNQEGFVSAPAANHSVAASYTFCAGSGISRRSKLTEATRIQSDGPTEVTPLEELLNHLESPSKPYSTGCTRGV